LFTRIELLRRKKIYTLKNKEVRAGMYKFSKIILLFHLKFYAAEERYERRSIVRG
jgi:hypothetical protein